MLGEDDAVSLLLFSGLPPSCRRQTCHHLKVINGCTQLVKMAAKQRASVPPSHLTSRPPRRLTPKSLNLGSPSLADAPATDNNG